jgi:Arc/MetJ-type ribon-helix-helix transcriptional regulator
MKIRQNFYLGREIGEALAAGNRGDKSHLVNDALRDWLARRGTREIDDLLKVRLDRLARDLDAARRDIDVLLESLSLLVRYQLMVTAPLAEADAVARAIGRDGFESFVAQVGRQIAAGTRTLTPPEAKGGKS